jgi:hypothetical protein
MVCLLFSGLNHKCLISPLPDHINLFLNNEYNDKQINQQVEV